MKKFKNKIGNFIPLILLLIFILILYTTLILKFFSNIFIYSALLSIVSLLIIIFLNVFKIEKNYLYRYPIIFLFLFILIFFSITIVTLISAIPIEPKGINPQPRGVEFNFYIVNDEINQKDLQEYISEANTIWNKYNISILTKEMQNVNINLTDEEKNLLYTNITKDKINGENENICNETYIPLINKITDNNANMSIIFINGEGNSGRGGLCGYSFIIFKCEKNSLLDLTGWNLAHEIGHILGLEELRGSGKMNLMNDNYKTFYRIISKTSFLNQEQINEITDKEKGIIEKNLK